MATTQSKYLPFSIKFDITGNIYVVDAKGKVLEPVEPNYPIETSKLFNLQAISIAKYQNEDCSNTTKRAATTTQKTCVQINIGNKAVTVCW